MSAETDATTFEVDTATVKAEYGIVTPNGITTWLDGTVSGPFYALLPSSIATEEGRGKARDLWRTHVENLGLVFDPDTHNISFVVRERAAAYSAPLDIEGLQR